MSPLKPPMTAYPIAALAALMTARPSRRSVLAALGALPAFFGFAESEARRRKKRRKRRRQKRNRAGRLGPNPSCTGTFDTNLASTRRFAQSFTAERSGALTSAEVEVSNLAGGEDFTMEIRTLDVAEAPTDTILASVEIQDVPATPSAETLMLSGTFDPPAPITKDQGYGLAVTIGEGQTFLLRGRSDDVCAGQLFSDTFADGTFSPFENTDMIFAVTITA